MTKQYVANACCKQPAPQPHTSYKQQQQLLKHQTVTESRYTLITFSYSADESKASNIVAIISAKMKFGNSILFALLAAFLSMESAEGGNRRRLQQRMGPGNMSRRKCGRKKTDRSQNSPYALRTFEGLKIPFGDGLIWNYVKFDNSENVKEVGLKFNFQSGFGSLPTEPRYVRTKEVRVWLSTADSSTMGLRRHGCHNGGRSTITPNGVLINKMSSFVSLLWRTASHFFLLRSILSLCYYPSLKIATAGGTLATPTAYRRNRWRATNTRCTSPTSPATLKRIWSSTTSSPTGIRLDMVRILSLSRAFAEAFCRRLRSNTSIVNLGSRNLQVRPEFTMSPISIFTVSRR